MCFSVAFCTVFQAFLTSFLIDSGYKAPIQNMDELLASGMKLAYPREFRPLIQNGDETEVINVLKNLVDCPSFEVCVKWALFHKNISIMLSDVNAELCYATRTCFGENSERLMCKLDDGVFFQYGLTMSMFHGHPLMRRFNEIIDRVVEAGIYKYLISRVTNLLKTFTLRISLVHPFDGYYSFNLYHLQPAFYLLLMGWCLSALCFMVELLYNRVFSGRK